ncbi:hypothetical protein WMY93_031071 [Mugilogobius chulae]|uniref:PB1 domain-containing protein n=1 Tax=Mugilogobius chulae TaxID=88201 RepID=A0AAW0MGX8_9GOBI
MDQSARQRQRQEQRQQEQRQQEQRQQEQSQRIMTFTVKACYNHNSEFRKFEVNNTSFSELEKKIKGVFSIKCANIEVRYRDEDGDMVLISSDEEFKIALKENATSQKIRVDVREDWII